uniref:Uncharacterized protein n=1 Tax=viral metagenome TaxID=1070528 RepID=A0A6C0HH38_9ZZZZ
MILQLCKAVFNRLKPIVELVGIYVVWICIHYLAGILYSYFCTPATLIGFITSSLLAITPECRALRWIIYNGGNTISDMWIIIGTWIASKLRF